MSKLWTFQTLIFSLQHIKNPQLIIVLISMEEHCFRKDHKTIQSDQTSLCPVFGKVDQIVILLVSNNGIEIFVDIFDRIGVRCILNLECIVNAEFREKTVDQFQKLIHSGIFSASCVGIPFVTVFLLILKEVAGPTR
jgi:hypothetical protein